MEAPIFSRRNLLHIVG